jgi:DNA-binding NarL/FixJ family response regulator
MSPAIATRVLHLFQNYVSRPEETSDEDYHLTQREKDVLRCMVAGKQYKVIADELNITYNTIRTHVKKIYDKLHVSSNTEAVSKAIKQKLV